MGRADFRGDNEKGQRVRYICGNNRSGVRAESGMERAQRRLVAIGTVRLAPNGDF